MSDLSAMSDADLMAALKAPQAAAAPSGLEGMSDADLLKALGQEPEQQGPPMSLMKDERPWYKKLGQAADDIARIGVSGITLGAADRGFGFNSLEETARQVQLTNEAKDRAGWAGTAAEIGGVLVPAGALSKGVGAVTGAAGRALGVGAPTGALGLAARTGSLAGQGAALGAAEAGIKGEDVGQGAAIGVLAGGVGNLAGEAIAKGVGKVAGAFNKKPVAPTTDELGAASRKAYQAADDAGVIVAPAPINRMAVEVQKDLTEFGYLPALQPKVGAVLDEISRVGQGNVTFKGIDQMRKVAGSLRVDQDASTRALGAKITDRIDEMVDSMNASDVLSGNLTVAAKSVKEGRAFYAMRRKSEMIDEAMERAINRTETTGTGGNLFNAMGQEFRKILDNPKLRRGFTPDEIDALRAIVRRQPTTQALHLLGRLSPQSGALPAMFGIGMTALNPMAALGSAAGTIAKPIAEGMRKGNVNRLSEIVRSGGTAPKATENALQQLARTERDGLSLLLSGSGLAAARE
jgi:hypothetical protein